MADETEKPKSNPIIDLIMRLINVYLAATFFFNGWEKWQNQEYLLAVSWFIFSFSQIAQLFGWFHHKSKLIRWGLWIPLVFALIIILSNQWL
jgi:uncharacterized membrane protein YphA (DoxX/SURF4 family)